jgi:hypothetical protein
MLSAVVMLHIAAAFWSVWAGIRNHVGRTVPVYLWCTLVATGIRYLFREGGTADVRHPNVAAVVDQTLFCAWAPGAYMCAAMEYGEPPRRVVALALASSVASGVLSLHVHQEASTSILIIQQLGWASALGLLIWDNSLDGASRDGTTHIFGVLTLELYIAAWFGLREREEYLVPQVLTGLFFLALPILAHNGRRPSMFGRPKSSARNAR